MDQPELIRRLHQAVDQMLDRPPMTGFASAYPPFDIERPNQHATKREFLLEKNLAQSCRDRLEDFLSTLVPAEANSDVPETRNRLIEALDRQIGSAEARSKPRDITELLVQNARDTGILFNTAFLVIELKQALDERLRELETQEQTFWSYKHRPPNPYARTIALRVAKLYASAKRAKPTVGTARDGGHPSTAYTKALEEIFKLLEIDARVTGPAKWAVSQLTEVDTMGRNALADLFYEGSSPNRATAGSHNPGETLGEILGLTQKGPNLKT